MATQTDKHKDAELFAGLLRSTSISNKISIGNFYLEGQKGLFDKVQYNQTELDLLKNEHQYTFQILDGKLQVSLQLYENITNHYRLFCYTRINGKQGMTFSINLTTEKESANVRRKAQMLST